MNLDWKKYFWINTLSSYLNAATRLAFGVVLFRQLINYFDQEAFGLWALFWSILTYAIFIDFGLGFTVQKMVAEKLVKKDYLGLNRFLSSVFCVYGATTVLMLTVFWCIQDWFLEGISVTPDFFEEARWTYLIFFAGMALMWPFGFFSEVLRGLQRVDLINWVSLVSSSLHLAALLYAMHLGWSLWQIMLVSSVSGVVRNLAMMVIAYRFIPTLKIRLGLFDWGMLKGSLGFAFTAYCIMCSNIVIAQTDQMVISWSLAVSAVTLYQVGFKLAEMLNLFSVQLQSAVSPAAASLKAKEDHGGLRDLFLKTSRINWLLITPCYVLSAVYLESLIQFMTKQQEVAVVSYWVGQILLAAIYSSQLTNASSKQILIMSGRQKAVLWISIGDAITNLAISIIFVRYWGLYGVAAGTLISTAFWGWFVVFPYILRFVEVPILRFVRKTVGNIAVPLLAFGATLGVVLWFFPGTMDIPWYGLGWRGLVVVIPLLALSLPMLKAVVGKGKKAA